MKSSSNTALGDNRRLILLDRDGVINQDSADYIKSVSEWHALPRSLDAIAKLDRAGFDVVVVTNQSGINRGLLSESDLEAIHAHMRQQIEQAGGRLGDIYYCPHRPDEHCSCRKPGAGLLRQIEMDRKRTMIGVPFIGDKLTDIQAAEAVGAQPIYVDSGLLDRPRDVLKERGVPCYLDLWQAVDALLSSN